MPRLIHTVFGEFEIREEDGIAVSTADNDLLYHLPYPGMTNDEIKDYFRILQEEYES